MRLRGSFPRGNCQCSLQAGLQSGLGCTSLPRVAHGPVIPVLIEVSRRLPEAVFSGSTAGWLHGLDLPPVDPVQVTVPNAHSSNRARICLRRAKLHPGDVVRLRGLPVTSALRTALDLGSRPPLVEAVVGLDMALHRRLVSLSELFSYVEANRGAKGIATLRRAIELAEPATESPMETRLRMLLVMARAAHAPRSRSTINTATSLAAPICITHSTNSGWSTTAPPTGTISSETTAGRIDC